MKEKQLYNMALESIKRYKGSGETLTDFNEFMDGIEKEYSTRTYKVFNKNSRYTNILKRRRGKK